MMLPIKYFLIFLSLILLNCSLYGQVNDFCAEFGNTPSLDSPFAHIPYVYGRVTLKGVDQNAKAPIIAVTMLEGSNRNRIILNKSGNYCFRVAGSGVTLVIEVNGIETTRRTMPALGPSQVREDFEIQAGEQSPKQTSPGVVSAKFYHPPNPQTEELYKKAVEAETQKDIQTTIKHLKEIVAIDPADFIAWAKLGSLYLEKDSLSESEAALRKSLELKVEYTPAWINIGIVRINQKQYEAAIEILKHAAELEPTSARAYQLLGEAYLQNKQGTLGAEALNQAIKLDPIGMAECHLQLAHLYQLAGAKKLATHEYKIFLTKKPDHPDRKKFEKFIKENPE